jgi:hypothetical protein
VSVSASEADRDGLAAQCSPCLLTSTRGTPSSRVAHGTGVEVLRRQHRPTCHRCGPRPLDIATGTDQVHPKQTDTSDGGLQHWPARGTGAGGDNPREFLRHARFRCFFTQSQSPCPPVCCVLAPLHLADGGTWRAEGRWRLTRLDHWSHHCAPLLLAAWPKDRRHANIDTGESWTGASRARDRHRGHVASLHRGMIVEARPLA